MKFWYFSLFLCFFIISCDASTTKRVSNLAVVKITDSNERSQEFIINYDTLRFYMADSGPNASWSSRYIHKVSFDEDDAGKVELTLRKGYSFTISPILTIGDVNENEARIRLQSKYNFDEPSVDPTETPVETPKN